MNNKSMQSILIFLVLICAKTQGVSVSEHFNLVQIGINEFFATRNVPTYFKKATAPFLMPNLFRHGIEFELNICDENVCSICEQISNGFINLKREQVPSNVTTDIAVKLCVAFGIENERVCQGTVERNMVVLDYMVENKPDITGRKLCAYTMYSNNCFPDEVTEWSIEVPKGSSPPRSEAKNSETFKILHLSDFHYDALYTPKGNSECGEPMCCQPDQAPPTQESDTCGYWHTYKNADSPLHTILATLNQTTTHDFDFVYYTGDVIAHRSWSTTVESNSRDIRLIFDSLKKYYNVPVYAVMGNHEPTPANVWVDSNVTDESVSMQWLFDVWAECMSDWLPDSAIETVKKGGYFTVSPKPGLRLVALNNNACYMANWWLPFNDFDSYGQLQWLTQVLQDAETNKESVHMIYHLPTGSDSCLKSWSIAYKQILERFANTIVGQFAGHTHHDEFMVYFNKSEVPIGVSHNGASVTTFMNSNPSYKLFDINRETFFVAHSNVQQLLASIWYEGLPGFRRKNMVLQGLEIVRIGILFPFFSVAYILAPHSVIGQTMRKPFIKFICHSASYFTFLFMLILASQTLFFYDDTQTEGPTIVPYAQRGSMPSLVEWIILFNVSGLIWSEIKQLWDVGLQEYVRDMWNVIDFITNSLYVATVALRIVSYYQVQQNPVLILRKDWDAWDPMLISEGLFSAANIFSSLKLVYIFSVNPHLGPLQVSLSRMVMDIMKFFFLFVLVLFAFSCGLNQLLWYYATAEKQKCPQYSTRPNMNMTENDSNACTIWRRFANLFETSQTLFWAVFGLVDLESFELNEIKIFTRFWGMLMFGTYSVINIVVLLNLLIAMMNHSYQLISERADVEWKFARSKLWISYFEEGGTAPPPFNIIPTPKSLIYLVQWARRKCCGHSRAAKKEHMRTIRRKVKQASERDFRYQSIMRNLVRRYVTVEQRKAENQGVTEDDVNEIKQDISAFRFELIEILKNSGMNTSTAHSSMGTGGKKNRQKERRLMKGFNIGPQPSTNSSSLPPVAEFIANLQRQNEGNDFFGSSISGIFHTHPRKLHQHSSTVSSSQGSINEGCQSRHMYNKLHLKRNHSHKRRWGTLIEAAKTGKVSRLIGRSRSEDSVCQDCQRNHSHSNSPASDDNSVSGSESNPSIDNLARQSKEEPHRGLAHGLALLKKKRKKFSASRNSSPVVPPTKVANETSGSVKTKGACQKINQVLKRASSVPTRVPEIVQIIPKHEKTQSQQGSVETTNIERHNQTQSPSSTDSIATVGNTVSTEIYTRPRFLFNSSSSNPTASSQTPEEEHRPHSHSQSLSKLPGVIPLSGHTGGWL